MVADIEPADDVQLLSRLRHPRRPMEDRAGTAGAGKQVVWAGQCQDPGPPPDQSRLRRQTDRAVAEAAPREHRVERPRLRQPDAPRRGGVVGRQRPAQRIAGGDHTPRRDQMIGPHAAQRRLQAGGCRWKHLAGAVSGIEGWLVVDGPGHRRAFGHVGQPGLLACHRRCAVPVEEDDQRLGTVRRLATHHVNAPRALAHGADCDPARQPRALGWAHHAKAGDGWGCRGGRSQDG